MSSGALPTLSYAQVEGREVCLAATAILRKQWTVYLEQDLKSKARLTLTLVGAQEGWNKETSITWLDLSCSWPAAAVCHSPHRHRGAWVAFV